MGTKDVLRDETEKLAKNQHTEFSKTKNFWAHRST